MAMTPKENSLAVLNGEQPDYYGDFMSTMDLVIDPIMMCEMIPHDGELHQDGWGVTKKWPLADAGMCPMINDENKVIKDICYWQDFVKFPQVHGLDWSMAQARAKEIENEGQKFVGALFSTGLFERSHYMMGFEDALCNYMEEPEAMHDFLRAVCDWKLECIDEWHEQGIKLEVVMYHDDWANKKSMFLAPEIWREFIKPLQIEIAQRFHDYGILYMHHSDCKCDAVATDMVEIGVDMWQGALPQNDLVKVQMDTRAMGRQLPMIGGLDGAMIDAPGVTEEQVRAEVRRSFDDYCGNGYFFPSNPFGLVFSRQDVFDWAMDEHIKYGKIYADEHRIA